MDLKSIMLNGIPFSDLNVVLIIFFVIWSLLWKGLALWRASQRGENGWFIVLLVLNTLGIVEIIYYFLIAKSDKKK
jgi:hypothetical protein